MVSFTFLQKAGGPPTLIDSIKEKDAETQERKYFYDEMMLQSLLLILYLARVHTFKLFLNGINECFSYEVLR